MSGNAYSVSGQTPAGTDLGLINITSDGSVRIKLYDLILGSDATPADLAGEFVINRSTTDGVGGSVITPNTLDPDTVAASASAFGGTFGTEPVDGTDLLPIPLNQRATFRWVAAPGSELIGPATADAGLFLRSVAHGGTPNMNSLILYRE